MGLTANLSKAKRFESFRSPQMKVCDSDSFSIQTTMIRKHLALQLLSACLLFEIILRGREREKESISITQYDSGKHRKVTSMRKSPYAPCEVLAS